MGLGTHLKTGKVVDRQEAAAWSASEEGKQFVALSSQKWRDASVAAGTDRAEAQAAADRTTAFYSGEAARVGVQNEQ